MAHQQGLVPVAEVLSTLHNFKGSDRERHLLDNDLQEAGGIGRWSGPAAPVISLMQEAIRPTGNTSMPDSYGNVAAALKQAIELSPLAQDRPFRVVIDGYSTWRSTRLWREPF